MDPIKAERQYGAKALEFCKTVAAGSKEKAAFPTIRPGTEEWRTWEAYFNGYLGFDPAMMKMVRAGRFAAMTVPSQWPEWFDGEYARQQADGVSRTAWKPPEQTFQPYIAQHRANVFVPVDNVLYPQMLDRSRNADEREFRYDQQRPGIWVARNWIDSDAPERSKPKRQFNKADLQAIYARNEVAP